MKKKYLMFLLLSLSLPYINNSFASNCYGVERVKVENFTNGTLSAKVSQGCTCGSSDVGFANLLPGMSHEGQFQLDQGYIFSTCSFYPSHVTVQYFVNNQNIGWSKFYKRAGGSIQTCNFAVSTHPDYLVECQGWSHEGNNSYSTVKIIKKITQHS